MIVGAGGLYSTTNDVLRWLSWHLDRFSTHDAEMRLLDHSAYWTATVSIPCSAWTRAG
jgi:D-alanyl-D-alanine-carboxypeptidase/D-alanyl-D-alanine-endopeptidase